MLGSLHSRLSSSRNSTSPSGLTRASISVALASLSMLAFAATAGAATAPNLGTSGSYAVLGGSGVTNTGPSVITGNLGTSPTPAISGFPPGILVGGVFHAADAHALQAKADLVTAYNNAAGQAFNATVTSDLGGQTLNPGTYRSGSSQQLTGPLTLNGQGNPNSVFIFQIGSSLTTASSSSVNLINGAQACNVYWQVGESATLGTSTAFIGNLMALTSITATTGASVNGRLLARNGAVTLDTNRITRSQCAAPPGNPGGPGPGGGTGGPGTGTGGPGGGGTTPVSSAPDRSGPAIGILRLPGLRQPPARRRGSRRPAARTVCTRRNFTASVRTRDRSGIRSVRVYLDGKRIRQTSRSRFSIRIRVRGLRVGSHRVTVVAVDRAGNRAVSRRRFGRCALALAAPRFTG